MSAEDDYTDSRTTYTEEVAEERRRGPTVGENRSARAAYSPGYFSGYPTAADIYREVPDFPRTGSVWRHQKGSDYLIVGPGMREDGWILQVGYVPLGKVGAVPIYRDAAIFMDGRFTALPERAGNGAQS